MEDGAGPIPILMAGAASESGLRTQAPAPVPTPVQQASSMFPHSPVPVKPPTGPDSEPIVNHFVHTYLSAALMKMSPKDGWVEAPERTWVLAGGAADPVLIYSLSGDDITLARALPANQYKALWLNPRSGDEQEADAITGNEQTVLKKPDTKDWLLLLLPQNGAPGATE
jgi:Putative collagen-binding domain of a collagenase